MPSAHRSGLSVGDFAGRLQWAVRHWALRSWCWPFVAAVLLYACASLFTFRLAGDGRIHFATIDNFLFLYTLEWERTSLFTEPHRFFEGLGFFGMGDSLFYTHLLLGGLPIYAVVATVLGPTAGLNFLVIVSPILNATVAAIAAWLLIGRWWPAVLAGFVFAFAPFQQASAGFLHMQMFWWTPLATVLWFQFLRHPAWWKISGAWLCVFIQFATGVYLGFIALITLLALMASALFFRGPRTLDLQLGAKSIAGIVVAALPFLPLLMGYVGFWLDNQATRTLDEARHLSEGLPSYMSSATKSLLWFQAVAERFPDASPLFPNVVSAPLAVFGLVMGVAYARFRTPVVGLVGAGLLLFLLSLGPELWWNGQLTGLALPFATAHSVIPGFASLRIAGLLAAGTLLPMALLAAIAVDRLSRLGWKTGWRRHVIPAALLVFCAIEFARSPVSVGPPPNELALHEALKESSDGAVAFAPSGAEFLTPDPYMHRMWWSLNGGRQALIGGYSGFTPRGTTYLARLVDWTDASNRRLVTEALVAFGVRSIVLDRNYLSETRTEEWQAVIQEVRPSAKVLDTGRFVVTHLGPDGISSAGNWSDVKVQPVLHAAVPDAAIVVPITLQNHTDVPWRPPTGRRTRSGEFHWTTVDGSPTSQQSFRFHVPPLIPANSSAQALTVVHARTPALPGQYQLALTVDGEQVAATDVVIQDQTLALEPRAVELSVFAVPDCVRSGESAYVQVTAENTGAKVWDGTFRLGTRWVALDGQGSLPEPESRLFMVPWLRVPSGSGVVFEGLVEAPAEPGFYRLTLGMVEESVAWFGEHEVLVHVYGSGGRETCVA